MSGTAGQRSGRRGWRAHALAAVAVVAALVVGYLFFVRALNSAIFSCVPSFSEATIVAPDSPRGRLLCSVDDAGELGFRDAIAVLLLAVLVLSVLLAVVVWLRSRRFIVLAPFLLLVALAPLALHSAMSLVRADCTKDEWQRHGVSGCERSEERRPGLGQY